MMMRALADGLQSGQVLYQPAQERIGNKREDGYIPNPSGLLEVGQQYYKNAVFLRKIPDNSVLKILYDGLANLPSGEYTIIFMTRRECDILASCQKVDEHLRQVGVPENRQKDRTFDVFRPYRQDDIDHVLGIVRQRKDMNLIEVRFEDVIADPESAFLCLSKRIPINAELAAKVVNPSYYRFGNANNEVSDAGASAQSEDSAD